MRRKRVLRPVIAWLVAMTLAAAGALGCSSAPTGAGPSVREAAPQAEANEGFGTNAETGDKGGGSSPKLPPGVPAKVAKVLQYIDENGRPLEGYEGGRKFGNFEGLLPKKDPRGRTITYQEWDVNPKVRGKNRGTERLVTGSDGTAYYTGDHYKTFKKIR
jgi:guanyl-specific ribonuclease Sa